MLWRVKTEVTKDHISLISAGVAFYALLALFPAITALLAIAGLLVQPAEVVAQLKGMTALMPKDVADIVLNQATAVAGSKNGGLGLAAVLGLGIAVYSASKGMASLMEGLNVAYDETETRGFFKLKAVTLLLTLGAIVGVLCAAGAMGVLPAMLSFLVLAPWMETLITAVTWTVLAALMVLALSLLYRLGPDREDAEFAWLTPGAVIACLVWIVASAAFAFYVSHFGSYNEAFGSLAGAIVLLMWLWISAFIVLGGAVLNAELEAQTRHDTTTGPDEPMGNRGATKADTYAGDTTA